MKRRDLNRIWARIRGEYSAKGLDEQGIALMSVILLILVLSFVSATAIVTSTTELKIGGNFKTSAQSFYNAEAGVQYALGQIRKQYDAGTLVLTTNPVVVDYDPPDTYPLLSDREFQFSNWNTTQLTLKTGTTLDYQFQTTGSYANSRTTLEAVLRMPSFRLVKGMFASGALEVKNNLACPDSPAPEFGSNTSLENGNNGEFSKVILGGNATYSGSAPVQRLPTPIPIDPYPGAERMVSDHNYSGLNNNESESVTGITDNKITAPTSLPPGNYYLTDLTTSDLTISGSGAVNIYVETNLSLDNVTINAGSGPLTIYYHGSADVDLESAVLNSGGVASNLSIISDSSALFDFKNNAVFSGLIYAPYADIDFQNNANVNGLLWGRTITAQNNLTVRYDATAASYFGAALIPRIMTWKQVQSP